MNIGRVIKDIRVKKGLRAKELAAMAGCSGPFLSQIELNKRQPSMELVQNIAKALGFPVYYFFFMGMDEEDVAEGKKEVFRSMRPAVAGMIEGFFLN